MASENQVYQLVHHRFFVEKCAVRLRRIGDLRGDVALGEGLAVALAGDDGPPHELAGLATQLEDAPPRAARPEVEV